MNLTAVPVLLTAGQTVHPRHQNLGFHDEIGKNPIHPHVPLIVSTSRLTEPLVPFLRVASSRNASHKKKTGRE